MKLTSPAFAHEGFIPAHHTCDGDSTSIPLHIEDVPKDTQSLTLIMEDPDVPPHIRKDRMWDHWIVYNIPPDTTHIREGHEPPGTHGTGTSGSRAYHGPCPPDKEHRYVFKLFALDTLLDMPEGASKKDVEAAMQGHIIDRTELIGRYARPQHTA